MSRFLFFCVVWTVSLICISNTEEIPFEKEPHPYTITFFQIPQQDGGGSPKEKKAVKDNVVAKDKINHKQKLKVPKSDVAHPNTTAPAASANVTNATASNEQVSIQNNATAKDVPKVANNSAGSPNVTASKRTVNSVPAKLKVEKKALKKAAVKGNSAQKLSVETRANNKINHEKRKKVANFVSIVNPANARDHALSFQKGALKHPQHTMYPTCHHCRENSTYASCIKRSTLKKCNEGLNNICYTRSVKRNSIIHYEMGCADHNTCLGARAFPCRDGSPKCFTCCQWDKCNSSPHHGDYELDNINLDELDSGSMPNVPSYLIPASILLQAIAAFFLM